MVDTVTQPHIYAHRGVHAAAPENSLAALREAVALGADGVEFDVQLTRDKVPVLHHDSALRGLTTTYDFIHRTPYAALQSLRLDPAIPNEGIPSLREALLLLRESSLQINIEIKNQPYWHTGLERRVVELVREFELIDRVTISSFSPLALMRCYWFEPSIARGLLIHPRATLLRAFVWCGRIIRARSMHISVAHLHSRLPQWIESAGYKLWVWTANSDEHVRTAHALGAEVIITDLVDTTQEHVRCAYELR